MAFWYGGWMLLDLYLKPDGRSSSDLATNGVYCLIIAFVLGMAMVVLDPWVVSVIRADAHKRTNPLLLFRLFVLSSLSIFAWRGTWRVADAIILSTSRTSRTVFALLAFFGGFALLALLGVASSLVSPPFAVVYEHPGNTQLISHYEVDESLWGRQEGAVAPEHPMQPEPPPAFDA